MSGIFEEVISKACPGSEAQKGGALPKDRVQSMLNSIPRQAGMPHPLPAAGVLDIRIQQTHFLRLKLM